MNQKISCSKRHFPADSPSEEHTHFRPHKATRPIDALGNDLIPTIHSPVSDRRGTRQIVRSKIAKLGERFICSNPSQTIMHEVQEHDAALPMRDMVSNNGFIGLGHRMKNGVAVPELGRRKGKERQDPHLDLLDDFLCEEESKSRPISPVSNRSRGSRRSRRTPLSPASVPSLQSPMARVLDHDLAKEFQADSHGTYRPERRHLRHHRNYYRAEQTGRRELRHYGESERPKSRSASPKGGNTRCNYHTSHKNYLDRIIQKDYEADPT